MEPIINKSFKAIIKEVDVKQGIIEGYFSTWGIVDAHEDEIVQGAYKKTIKEAGPESSRARIFHLWQHNARTPLSRFTEEGTLKEDATGLFFHSKISRTTWGRDALLLYEDGVINEHSVGIQVIKSERATEGHNRIREVKLWEGSSVTWGANEDTPVTSMKDMNPIQQAEKFNDRIDLLTKSLRDGSYSDETFILLELQLKQVQGHYQSLINQIQPGKPLEEKEQPGERVSLDVIFSNLNL